MSVLIIGIGLALIVFYVLRWTRRASTWRIRSARRVATRLRAIDGNYADAKRFAYLRKIDPFVFEELILLCFQRRGFATEHTPYTRDGGIDGRVWLPDGRAVVLQAKRYRAHIQAAHVRAFRRLVEQRGELGLFVHTGRTGRRCYHEARGVHIEIVGGAKLLALLLGEPLEVFGTGIQGWRQ